MTRSLALFALTVLPLAAQSPQPSTIEAVGDRTTITGNSGLQPSARGLRAGGAAYRAEFAAGERRFEPALGRLAPTTSRVSLAPQAMRRGEQALSLLRPQALPQQRERCATFAHDGGVEERFDVRPEGLALSWHFPQPLAGDGDLVVRYAVASSLGAPVSSSDGLRFGGEHGGVHIGGVTGIDARGRSVPGSLQWVEGGIELSLPDAFLDSAAYPIVLDPLIGTWFPVSSGLTFDDGEPDAAYDATTNRFLVVWRRTFSATDSDVRGQLVTAGGSLVGGTIFFGSSGVVSPPRVANLGVRDRFVAAWSQLAAGTSSVEFQAVEAGSGALGFATTVASSTTDQFAGVDIGSQTEAPVGSNRGVVVVYDDPGLDAIRARRYWWNAADSLLSASAFSVFTDTLLGVAYSAPAIARTAAADGKLLVVARRRGVLLGNSAIEAAVVDAGGGGVSLSTVVATSNDANLGAPDVDGYASRWNVAWERAGLPASLVYDAVRVAPVAIDPAANALVVGGAVTFGGSLISQARAPSLGYTPGRTWLGYELTATLPAPATTTLRVAAIDSGTCTSCNDSFTVGFPDGPRIVVATGVSGGLTTMETALVVYHDTFHDVNAQLLRNYGTSGSIVDLGGACGASGFQSFSHSPGIGSSGLRNTLSGLPGSTLAAIFNFSQPTGTSVCGPCVWVPFSVTVAPPILGGTASVEFGIPCLPALVGAQFESQWTTIDFSQAPCALFPGLTNSNRLLMTVGQ